MNGAFSTLEDPVLTMEKAKTNQNPKIFCSLDDLAELCIKFFDKVSWLQYLIKQKSFSY